MIQYLVIALITALVALGGLESTVKAETVDINVKIEGIVCDLDAVYAELGHIPNYCANRPQPVEAPEQAPSPPSSPVTLPRQMPVRSFPMNPAVIHPIRQPQPPQVISLPSTNDVASSSPAPTLPDFSDIFLSAVVLVASVITAVVVDIVYYSRTLTRKVQSFFTSFFK